MSYFDFKTPDERAAEARLIGEERHQLHWLLDGGILRPRLTCLHRPNLDHQRCAQDLATDEPELFNTGFVGGFPEARDGIITTRWTSGNFSPYDGGEDESEFQWDYVPDNAPVPLQRHSVRYVLGEDEIQPVFECLHPEIPAVEHPCDAELWRDELYAFQEHIVGPAVQPMRPGIILSWWPDGIYSDDWYPFWGYEDNLSNQLIANSIAEHKARTTISVKKVEPTHE